MTTQAATNSPPSALAGALHALRSPDCASVADWAERYRFIGSGFSSRPGRWRNSNNPPAVEIMEATTDPDVRKLTFVASSQVGKTEILLNAMGYYMHIEPTAIMYLSSADELAREFVKLRVRDMINNCPELAERVASAAAGQRADGDKRQSGQRMTYFEGGYLLAVGAQSVNWLSSNPVQIVFSDERDRYPSVVGSISENRIEGDPAELAKARTKSYRDAAKFIQVSSPTTLHSSPIYAEFMAGDQRHFHLPCPECGEFQVLEYENLHYPRDGRGRGDYKNAYFACVANGCVIPPDARDEMLAAGEWRADAPENGEDGHRSYHLWAAYSPIMSWADIARDHAAASAGGEEKLRAYFNTTLGRVWEDPGALDLSKMDAQALAVEEAADGWRHAVAITAGIDVQGDRFEITICAWRGTGYDDYACHVLDHLTLEGSTDDPAHWQALSDRVAAAEYGRHRIRLAFIDAGYQTDLVLRFVAQRRREGALNIAACRGSGQVDAKYLHHVAEKDRAGQKRTAARRLVSRPADIYVLGVNQIKNALAAAMKAGTKRLTFAPHLTSEYYKQMQSETRERRRERGRDVLRWLKAPGVRNEALDCWNYAFAAFHALRLKRSKFAEENARNKASGAPEVSRPSALDASPGERAAAEREAAKPAGGRRRRARPPSIDERRRRTRRI